MKKEELEKRLKQLDEDACVRFGNSKKFNIVIVGGSSLVLLGIIDRSTLDIDAIKYDVEYIKEHKCEN